MGIITPATDAASSPPERSLSGPSLVARAEELARRTDSWRECLPIDPLRRTGVCLVSTDTYDAWLLRWPPETSVAPHDHGESSGVYVVVSGELTEIRWHDGTPRARRVGPGELVTIDRGQIHDVAATEQTSISIHVYSPPLTTMSFYDPGSPDAIEQHVVDTGASVYARPGALQSAGAG